MKGEERRYTLPCILSMWRLGLGGEHVCWCWDLLVRIFTASIEWELYVLNRKQGFISVNVLPMRAGRLGTDTEETGLNNKMKESAMRLGRESADPGV